MSKTESATDVVKKRAEAKRLIALIAEAKAELKRFDEVEVREMKGKYKKQFHL